MNEVITMRLPDLGEGIESATISEIPISKGEKIKKDDIMIVLESEKASMEIPSEVGGIVKSVNIKNGQSVKTGDLLLTIETEMPARRRTYPARMAAAFPAESPS